MQVAGRAGLCINISKDESIIKVKSSMARSSKWRIYYHCSWGQLSTTCSNATEVVNNDL